MPSILETAMGGYTNILHKRVANEEGDSNIGSARASNSASSLLSTLTPVLIVAVIWLTLFIILRKKFPRNYTPRTFLGSLRESERTPNLPSGAFNWVGAFFHIPDTVVLNSHSFDGFLFLRFLKMSVVTCLVGCAITWPILFPVNITGGGGSKQLDILSMSNINSAWRYWAHAGCAYLFFGFVIFMITRECIYYINLRQAYLMSPLYARRISSRTVLYTSVPEEYLDEAKIREILGPHVARVWIPTDTSELEDMVAERDKIALLLEGAETNLCKIANAARLKALKKGSRVEEEEAGVTDDGPAGSAAARWITPKQRPTHRLKPLIGKKVDTIEWCRNELHTLIPKVDAEQEKHRALHADAQRISSVFVEFDSLAEAQSAYQSLTHHQPLHMAPRYTGMYPGEVLWSNLRIKWWERIMRVTATTSFVVALVIFWSIPVAFVGAISNVDALTKTSGFGWLSFINNMPSWIRGVITGLLPVILLAVLMALLPIVLRLVSKLSGNPTLSAVELTVQHYYFGFQVVQVFLVATLGSAATASIQSIIDNPSSALNLLAKNIPKASNFYLSYFVLQGLGVMSGVLVGLVGLIISRVLGKLLDTTPRKIYARWASLAGLGWGTVIPVYTNLFVIAICYACIAPLVLGFAAIGLWLFYFAYRYNMLFVYNINVDTKGLIYPRALMHLFVGLYIAEVCLIGLFAIALGKGVGALGPLILMIIFLIFTALYHLSLVSAMGPLLQYLPKNLEMEERRLLEADDLEGEHVEMSAGPKPDGETAPAALPPPPHKKPSFIAKFLKPHIYQDYATMRRLVPRDITIEYEPEVERDAFFHPSITSPTPLLWIPRDPAGVSRQEVRDTSKVIPITDEGAYFSEENKIVWDAEAGTAPVHEDKIYY